MSIAEIIQYSLEKNPIAMKEALDEEMKSRIAAAIEEKMIGDMSEDTEEEYDDEALAIAKEELDEGEE